jgi:hypothetical protein
MSDVVQDLIAGLIVVAAGGFAIVQLVAPFLSGRRSCCTRGCGDADARSNGTPRETLISRESLLTSARRRRAGRA